MNLISALEISLVAHLALQKMPPPCPSHSLSHLRRAPHMLKKRWAALCSTPGCSKKQPWKPLLIAPRLKLLLDQSTVFLTPYTRLSHFCII